MNIKNRQEIINLMPWYNLGKLSDAEKLMVDEAIANDSSLREQLSLETKIMKKVVAEPAILDKSAFESNAVRLNNVLARIDETVVQKIPSAAEETNVKDVKQSTDFLSGFKSFFTDLLSGSSHSFTYAVFAALTVVQLALLMFFVVPTTMHDDDTGFGTASGESRPLPSGSTQTTSGEATSSLVLVVAMEDNIQIEGFTSKQFGEIKFELLPDSYGYYRIRLNKKLTPDEIEVLKNELSHKTNNVIFVGEEIQSQ